MTFRRPLLCLPARSFRRAGIAGVLVIVAGLSACSMEFKGQATEYKLSKSTLEILGEDSETQETLLAELERLFGTQAKPTFAGADGTQLAQAAKLYGNKCLHCHGNEGGGDGVTSFSLSPAPRDFRRGIFKFDNIANGGRPELGDLEQVITNGINGTGMPSLRHLEQTEIAGLAEYVRYLAIRGEVETWLAAEYVPGTAITSAEADDVYGELVSIWLEEERVRSVAPADVPEPTEASIRRGAELFHDATGAACASCHGSAGQGEGPSAWGFTEESPEELVPLLLDAWGREATPRDLTSEILRHGDEPSALFERIYLGIDGTPMAGIGDTSGPDGAPLFSTQDLWSLVHYVRALRDPEWEDLTDWESPTAELKNATPK